MLSDTEAAALVVMLEHELAHGGAPREIRAGIKSKRGPRPTVQGPVATALEQMGLAETTRRVVRAGNCRERFVRLTDVGRQIAAHHLPPDRRRGFEAPPIRPSDSAAGAPTELELEHGHGATMARRCNATRAVRCSYRPGSQTPEHEGWLVVCAAHGFAVHTDTLRASQYALGATDWCPPCQAIVDEQARVWR